MRKKKEELPQNEVLERCERAEEMWCYPRFLTIKADALIKGKLSDTSKAESCLNRAMALSEEQGSKFWLAGILADLHLIGAPRLQTV